MKKSFCDYMTPIGTVLNIKSAIAMGSYSIIFLRVSFDSFWNFFFYKDLLVYRERLQLVRKFSMDME
jgi:hypothetical protein